MNNYERSKTLTLEETAWLFILYNCKDCKGKIPEPFKDPDCKYCLKSTKEWLLEDADRFDGINKLYLKHLNRG